MELNSISRWLTLIVPPDNSFIRRCQEWQSWASFMVCGSWQRSPVVDLKLSSLKPMIMFYLLIPNTCKNVAQHSQNVCWIRLHKQLKAIFSSYFFSTKIIIISVKKIWIQTSLTWRKTIFLNGTLNFFPVFETELTQTPDPPASDFIVLGF
jgi:hypothetical protein